MNVVVCRCEEVTMVALEDAYRSGVTTSRELKMKTRATMGYCQGRTCRHLVDAFIHQMAPDSPHVAERLSYRPPIRPVTFGELARGEHP